MTKPVVLFVGDPGWPEFQEALDTLRQSSALTLVDDLRKATATLGDPVPELIVMGQGRPGQIPAHRVERLRLRLPLTRFITVLGAWAEGETRTGFPLDGVARIYWHQAGARLRRELHGFERGICPTWGLPPTSTDEERLLWDSPRVPITSARHVIVHTPGFQQVDWLVGVCTMHGWHARRLGPLDEECLRDADVLLWDAGDFGVAERRQLQGITQFARHVPILALLSFPRFDDVEQARAIGVQSVLSKPCLVADLVDELNRLSD